MQNRAAVLHGVHDLRIDDVPVPEPGPKEVLVDVHAVGVCGSDVHYYEHGRVGAYVVRKPLILGHESGGVIVEQGPGATRHQVGQRVALKPGIPCGACRQCRAGRYNLCPEVRFFATPPVHGAFCNYVTIHQDFAFALPEGVSDDAGALIEPLSVGIWACRKAHLQGASTCSSAARAPSACWRCRPRWRWVPPRSRSLTSIPTGSCWPGGLARPERSTCASSHSAKPVSRPTCCWSVRGIPPRWPRGSARCGRQGRRGGRHGAGREATIPLALLQNREITLTGTFRYANIYPTAIELVAAGRVHIEAIVTGHFPLEQTELALQASKQDPESVKAVVVPADAPA